MSNDMQQQVAAVESNLAQAGTAIDRLFKLSDDHTKGLQRASKERKVLDGRVDQAIAKQEQDHTMLLTHSKKLQRLNEELEQLKNRPQILGDHMTDEQSSAIIQELERLDGQAKSFTRDLQGQVDTLKQRVDDIQEQVDMHGPEIARAHDRIDIVDSAPMLDIDPATTKLELTGSVKSITPWGKGIIAGVIAFLVALFIITPIFDNWETASEVSFSLLFGLGVMLFVASFESYELKQTGKLLWGKHDRKKHVDENQTTVIPSVMPDDANQAPDDKSKQEDERVKQEVKA